MAEHVWKWQARHAAPSSRSAATPELPRPGAPSTPGVSRPSSGRRVRASFLPVPVLAALTAGTYLAVPPSVFWDPAWAIVVGNTVFVTGVSLVVAAMAFRTFSANGRAQLLLLGCGVLTFGIAAAVAAAARGFPDGANLNVTIYNVGALLGGALHGVAGFLLASGSTPEVPLGRRTASVRLGVALSAAAVLLLALACRRGLVPPFFVQRVGATALRQVVLAGAAMLFLFASAVATATYMRTREAFLYWYACALALIVIGLSAIFVQHSVGSPVGWVGRASQYAGGVYFLVALVEAARTAQLRGVSLENVLTASFSGAEEKFRALAENAPDVIRRFDRSLNHIYVNVAGQRLYGKPAGALLGRGLGVAGVPEEQATVWGDRIRRVFETGASEQVEEYLDTEDGPRFYQSLCVPEHGPGGAVANVLVLSRDLTERRRAEEQTRRQNAVVAGIVRIYQETLGAETEEELGRTCLAVAEEVTESAYGFLAELDPQSGRLDDVAISDAGWSACGVADRAGHGRKLPAGLPVHGIYGRVVKDGRSLIVNDPSSHPDHVGLPPGHAPLRAFLGVPLASEGRVVGMVALANRPGGYGDEHLEVVEHLAPAIVQALERKRAQRALRESEERYRLLFEERRHAAAFAEALNVIDRLIHSTRDLDEIMRSALSEAVGALGATTAAVAMREGGRWVVRYVHGLPAATVGAAVGDEDAPDAVLAVERREPLAVSDALHDERVNRDRMAAWDVRSVLVVPLVVRDEGLGVCSFHYHRAPVELGTRQVDFAVKLGSSMSLAIENARLFADLRDAGRRKDEFLGMLSHELRNPLAPIRNSVFILERAADGSEAAARARDVIRRQTEHLTRLIDDLLDVTRISRGKIELHRTRVDLRELGRRACDDHRTLFKQHGIELTLEAGDSVWIDADETRILQVMGNLLQNAARFGREHGAVAIAVGVEDGQASIRVRDDGIGIAPEFLPRIFEPFVQEERGLARTRGGLGLGLALVKGIVALHGGAASAHSEGPGRGAEFRVALPLAAAPPGRPAEAPAPVRRAAGGLRILVVDDNPDEAASLCDALEIVGYGVSVTHDGEEALARARTFQPAVILCDIGLPRMNGFEVARAVRSDPALAGVKLVALTGYARPEDVAATREAGFDQHIAKPATIGDIERAINAPAEPRAAQGPAARPPAPAPIASSGAAPVTTDAAVRARALEAFLSRAFHDVRAPFRHIDGFCDVLLEDFAAGLGEDGRRHVSQIRLARTRAQELVEDLLTLWRVANADLAMTQVDLSAIARELAAALARREPGRRVELEVEDGVTARGDPGLLRVVLEHLLGNAWKYTARHPTAHVTFGRAATPDGPGYLVRDDGDGFDMSFAGTLFEPFQRLHSLTDFEGTGLGLYIVRRIVERHGGRAWIECAPGAGTSVRFTLASGQ